MRGFVRWALVPLMRLWASVIELRMTGVPRPTDAPQAHSAGLDSDRILVVGSGPAVGWGVLSHDLALPGSLARALSGRTGRGTDVDVLSRSGMTVSSLPDAVYELKLRRYDAVVITLGANDAAYLTSLRLWRRRLSRVLCILEKDSSRTTHIFVVGIHPFRSFGGLDKVLGWVIDRHARTLNRATAGICAESPRASFVPLLAAPNHAPDRFQTPEGYRYWAELMADRMSGVLDTEHRKPESTTDDPVIDAAGLEVDRQWAVDGLGILDTMPEDRFDTIVTLAKHVFGTSGAAFSVIDNDRLWQMANAGGGPKETPRNRSFSAVTIQGTGPMVVRDALADERFRDNALMQGETRTRFYAGYPVESPSGQRIGALCVFDPLPGSMDNFDQVLLRELALMVQGELWQRPDAA